MRTWMHVTRLAGMSAAFAVSFVLLQKQAVISAPWMVLFAMFCFLGLARIAEPLYRLKVPQSLARVRDWEPALDRKLGVPAFGNCLRNTPLRALNSAVYLAGRRDPHFVIGQLESAEAIHFWAAVLLLPYMAYCALHGQWVAFGGFLLVQIVGNLYPIMHLRLVRGRLDAMVRRSIRRRGRSE